MKIGKLITSFLSSMKSAVYGFPKHLQVIYVSPWTMLQA